MLQFVQSNGVRNSCVVSTLDLLLNDSNAYFWRHHKCLICLFLVKKLGDGTTFTSHIITNKNTVL